ncbi:MAG TPA: VCBS repeat-containing protein, partial [Opitutaceae bacterium]|nr:VCBS repeat-containing protein [Opitutaceae bacterium]
MHRILKLNTINWLFHFLVPLTAISTLVGAPAAKKQVWTTDSFRQFSEGSFADSGVNLYAAADGTVRLINAFDFNRDGLPDIFLPSNGSDSSVVDLSIYWDKPGYDPKAPTRLPTEGGKDAAVADLDRDGWPDLVVVNDFDGTKNELNAYIYWGSAQGFSPERRSTLPTQGAQGVAIADLNNDGFPEIVVANSGLTYHVAIDKIQQSYLYWNRKGKFSADDRAVLPTINGRDVAIADLNADGTPDLAFACGGNERDEAGARIFWSTPAGYSLERSQFLPGESSVALAIGDLDRDGRPDLVLVNSARITGREGGIYTLTETTHLNSYLYFNSPQGFSTQRRTGLPTVSGSGAALADVDNDGWPDVVFSNAGGDASFV